jgi:hypothetical protein
VSLKSGSPPVIAAAVDRRQGVQGPWASLLSELAEALRSPLVPDQAGSPGHMLRRWLSASRGPAVPKADAVSGQTLAGRQQLWDWLPESDFAVLDHGFAARGRDYSIVIQDCLSSGSGPYRLIFSHVVIADYRTALWPNTSPQAQGDDFLDWDDPEASGGQGWGTSWSKAYPGLMPLPDDVDAIRWSEESGRRMHAVRLQTDRFELRLVFNGLRAERLSDGMPKARQVVHPLE